ncbi:MAG: branched-chain amino acid transaminase [bacterium]|nr:branched-chain amino acid transaminase [bacterium]
MKYDKWKTGQVKYLFLDGEIVPYNEASIHVFTPAFRYGAIVFEGIRGYWNEDAADINLFRVKDHCRRLNQSMKMSRMDLTVTEKEMINNIIDLIKQNDIRETIHIICSAYIDGDGPMSSVSPIGTTITIRKVTHTYDVAKGIRCSTSRWRRNSDDSSPMRIKSAANYQNSRLALLQARQDGYDSAILLNHQGKVAEGPGACLFLVRDGCLIAPSVTSDQLEGLTRDTIIKIYAEQFHGSVIERPVDSTELYIAEEMFFCGSGAEIVPIVEIDGFAIEDKKPGQITKKLMTAYNQIVTGKTSEHPEWRTAVYNRQ